MCTNINFEDLSTIYHEYGHIYYYRQYKDQPYLFRDGANDGFHEAIGDTILKSVTVDYLKEIELLPQDFETNEINYLMSQALPHIAFFTVWTSDG
eukprot:UN03767